MESPVRDADAAQVQRHRDAFLEACGATFDELLSADGTLWGRNLTALEERIQERSRSLATQLMEKRLQGDPLAQPGQTFLCPKCTRALREQKGAARRTVPTSLGPVKLCRPYCVCEGCGWGGAPLDYAFGLPSHGPSVARRELICDAATAACSFEKAEHTLSKHSKIMMTPEGIRKHAETEGRRLLEAQQARLEACFTPPGRLPSSPTESVALLVVTCDGGMVQTRQEHTQDRWKESKVGAVYQAEPHPDPKARTAEKYEGAKALVKTYVATMAPWEELGRMLFLEAWSRGYGVAAQKLFISDAANGIMSLYAEHFSEAILIIDWYHAAKHLSRCAKAAFGQGTPECDAWYVLQKDRLWYGKLPAVLEAIQEQSTRLGPSPPKAPDTDPRVVLHRNVGYFTTHQQAMDYPSYRAKGWPIASGVAEGSVKQFGKRVKGAEQFWNLWGADEMLALCALYYSEDGRWEKYWRRRGTPPVDAEAFLAMPPPSRSNPP